MSQEVPTDQLKQAVGRFASGVTVVTVRDEREDIDDDIGTTVTAFASVSLEPPRVLVSIAADSYMDEVLGRQGRWTVSLLAAGQTQVAGRFATAARPSGRLLLANLPHHRGTHSDALVVDGGLAALECETRQRVPAGDHTVIVAGVLAVDYVSDGEPLLHFRGRYR